MTRNLSATWLIAFGLSMIVWGAKSAAVLAQDVVPEQPAEVAEEQADVEEAAAEERGDIDDGEFDNFDIEPFEIVEEAPLVNPPAAAAPPAPADAVSDSTPARESKPLAAQQKELDQLVTDFNTMFTGGKVALVTRNERWHQIQVYLGPYEKRPQGEWVQKGTCENKDSYTPGREKENLGTKDAVNRLAVENGKFVNYTSYTSPGQNEDYGPAAIEAVGNGVRTRAMGQNWRNGWETTDYYRMPNGQLANLRTWHQRPEWDDYWYEVGSLEAAEAEKKAPKQQPTQAAAAAQAQNTVNGDGELDGDGDLDSFDIVPADVIVTTEVKDVAD